LQHGIERHAFDDEGLRLHLVRDGHRLDLLEDIRRRPSANRLFASVRQDQAGDRSRRLAEGPDTGPSQGGGDQTRYVRFPTGSIHMNADGNAVQPSFMPDFLNGEDDADDKKERQEKHIRSHPNDWSTGVRDAASGGPAGERAAPNLQQPAGRNICRSAADR